MLRGLVERADHMQEQMDNVSRDGNSLRNNQKEMLGTKNTIKEMKDALDRPISRLHTAKDRINQLKYVSKSSQIEMQRAKRMGRKEGNGILKNGGTVAKRITYM